MGGATGSAAGGRRAPKKTKGTQSHLSSVLYKLMTAARPRGLKAAICNPLKPPLRKPWRPGIEVVLPVHATVTPRPRRYVPHELTTTCRTGLPCHCTMPVGRETLQPQHRRRAPPLRTRTHKG
jgi:hypothetical protein